jgi:RNA recognition motif-containing protein
VNENVIARKIFFRAGTILCVGFVPESSSLVALTAFENDSPSFPLQLRFGDASRLVLAELHGCRAGGAYHYNVEDTMKNLYVGNMERSTTEQDLRTAFGTYGPIGLVLIKANSLAIC